MILLLALIPWVLTVGVLLFIMAKGTSYDYDYEEEYEDDESVPVVKVAVYEEKAYWVYENIFYESEVTREPDFTTARPIDTMSMSSKQLNDLLNILDELKEETERE
jgi:hypothetical protein